MRVMLAIVTLVVSCKKAPLHVSQDKFLFFEQNNLDKYAFLSKHVHHDDTWYQPDPSKSHGWLIAYGFSPDCKDDPEIEGMLTASILRYLKVWLSPIKEIAINPVVDQFYFEKGSTTPKGYFGTHKIVRKPNAKKPHLSVVFHCNDENTPNAPFHYPDEGMKVNMFYYRTTSGGIYLDEEKKEYIKTERQKDDGFSMNTLLHELGHSFGLYDTYAMGGGLKDGQVGSIMAGASYISNLYANDEALPLEDRLVLAEDDILGIQYLYRYYHDPEALRKHGCGSEEYVLAADGCIHKNPVIYILKQAYMQEHLHNNTDFATTILSDLIYSPVDAKEKATGNSELHYAVLHGAQSSKLKDAWTTSIGEQLSRTCEYKERYNDREVTSTQCRSNDECIINAQNNDGDTALHYVARTGYLAAVEKMLACEDISVGIKNNQGETACAIAQQKLSNLQDTGFVSIGIDQESAAEKVRAINLARTAITELLKTHKACE